MFTVPIERDAMTFPRSGLGVITAAYSARHFASGWECENLCAALITFGRVESHT